MDIKFATVRYENSPSEYCFKTDLELKKGQVCIVKARNGFGIVKVVNPNETDPNKTVYASAFILCTIDLRPHLDRVAKYG